MYIKVNNNTIEKYPYSIDELKKDNYQTSFPDNIPESLLNEYGVFSVKHTPYPDVGFDKNVTEGTPELVDGIWKQVWTVVDASLEEHLARISQARAAEYPPITDYLDGLVKKDDAQVEKYINDCLAVKAKYPKP